MGTAHPPGDEDTESPHQQVGPGPEERRREAPGDELDHPAVVRSPEHIGPTIEVDVREVVELDLAEGCVPADAQVGQEDGRAVLEVGSRLLTHGPQPGVFEGIEHSLVRRHANY